MNPQVRAFFDKATHTISYVVSDPKTRNCAVIDSVLDYDAAAGRTSTASADRTIAWIRSQDLAVEWILETHIHADHLSAAPYIQQVLGGQIGIGDKITDVQQIFGKVFNEGTAFQRDGSQFDHLFSEGDLFSLGELSGRALHTPGHTPACMTFVIGDAAFVGDTMFMPDFGTARCDFPGGSAETLYRSIQKILSLPPETRIFVGHDYLPKGRSEFAWETTVAEQSSHNIHIGHGHTAREFIEMRETRDATLGAPKLILPSLQVNMRAGQMPDPAEDGSVYLKIPLNKI